MAGEDRNANVVLTADVNAYNQNISQAEQNTSKLLAAVTGVTVAMNKLAQSSGKSIQLVGAGTLAGLTAATASAARFQTQMQQLEASAMMTGRSHEKMTRQVQGLRSEVNLTTGEITGLITQLNKLGQGNRDVGSLAKSFVSLGAITGESIPALTQSMILLQRQMGTEGTKNTEKYASVLATLSTNMGTSATGITEFANAIAPVANLAKVSQQEVMGFSAVFAKSGADGIAGANAFNKVLTDITRSTQFGGPELKAYANLLGITTEEFKRMGSTEQVTQVFEKIIDQGPQAIQTLEKFGLDGMRTYKAMVSVMGQGGFREALGLAEEGGSKEGITKSAEAAQKAMAGLEDTLGKLSNTLGKIGQAFGTGLLQPLEVVAQSVNKIMTPFSKFMDLLGAVPGLMAAVSAGALLMGGTLIRSIGGMLGLAGAAQLARSAPVAGWAAGRRGQSELGFRSMPAWQQIIAKDVQSQAAQRNLGIPRENVVGRAGLWQRMLFSTGYGLGQAIPGGAYDPEGRGLIRRGVSGVSNVMGRGINLAGWLTRIGLDPLRPSSLYDITNREQVTQNMRSPSVWNRLVGRSYEGMQSGRQGVREAFTRMVAPPVVAQTAGARLIDAESKARQRHTGIIANTGRELAKLGAASARATAGLAGVGLGVAGHAATKGIGALGRGLGVMGSLVGGVGGATLLGGMYVGGKIIDARAREKDAISDTEDYSSASAYRTALGQASMATQSFADAVNQARNDIEGGAGGKGASPTTVSEEDVRQARTPGRAYTDPRFANMGQQEAGAFISTALPNLDEAGKQLLKLDALKRFGNAQMVEDWMGQTTPDLAGLFENVGKQRWFSIGLTDESIKAGQGAGTSGAGIVNVAPADQTEEVRAAALLEGVWGSVVGAQKEKQKEWLPNTAQEDMSLKAAAYGVANMLGTSDDESYKEIVGALRAGYQGKNAEDTWRKFYDKLLAGKSTAAQLLAQSPEVAKFIPRPVSQVGGDDLAYGWNNYTLADEPQEPAETPLVGGKRQTQIALERVNRQAMADPWQYWEVDREAVRGTSLGGLLMGRPNLQDAGFNSQQDIANNMFNRGRGPSTSYGVLAPEVEAAANLQGSEAYKSITKALTTLEPGWDRKAEYDLQQFALGQSGGDFAKADVELQKLAAVIGDTNSEFYQLIQGARGLGDTFQGIELSSASSMQVASALVQRAELSRENWEKNPEAPDSFPAMMADMQAVQQQRDAMRGRNMAIVVGKRELDIGLSRGREDFDRSMGFREDDFYLQRDRAERDRNIQLERMDTHRNIQLARTWRDYNIQRERSEYEFNLQRRRGDQSYGRQLQRTWRDYNIQRERSQYEFNLSRERQEEDFNHQLEVMAKRSAQSIYNIYERVAVARTLSGQNMVGNLADQQRRLSEQNANLDIARGMGLSNAAIQMLGLGDAANAQQLARLIQDMMKDPALVEALNSSIKERTDATTALITDQASLQWEEMRREYGLSMERAAEDFNRMREQQAKDFMTGLNDQRTEYNIQLEQSLADYNRMRNQQQSDFQRGLADQASDYLLQLEESRQDWNLARSEQLADFLKQNDRMYDEMDRQQKRATDDFSRNAEEIVASNEELAELAIAALTGTAKTQYEELNKILFGVGEEVKTNVSDLAKHVVEVADQLGLTGIFINFKGGSGGGSSGRMQYKAEGGTIDGYSPHDKADNIVIKATAGEYMQPVKAVQHYGVDVMEAIRNREIPKEALQGFADGGLVGGSTKEASLINFGRWLQGQGYHVGEHPSFGGVMAGAHLSTARGGLHYVGKAIDVNYDGFGQQRENSALDAIIKAAERLGLGYIWRSANHYDHAHFDVSARRRLNGQTISVAEGLSDIITDDQGNTYDQAFFNLLKEKKSFRKFERSMDRWKILRDNYEDDTLAKAVSMKVAESIGASQDIEDYESGRMSNGVERWRPMVLQALDRMNQPANLADVTLRRMMQESSGNPRAINLWDSNAKAGTPSKGLMQVIDPTFKAYRDRGLVNDIWNPMANIVASMRYALDRYGSLYSAYSRPGGYAEGGEIKKTDWYGSGALFKSPTKIGVGESGPEMVLPLNNQGAEFLSGVMRKNSNVAFKDAYTTRNSVPEVSKRISYNYKYDHSTNFTGPVSVMASDPNEMARKLEMKKREAALIGRRS